MSHFLPEMFSFDVPYEHINVLLQVRNTGKALGCFVREEIFLSFFIYEEKEMCKLLQPPHTRLK